MFKKLLKIIRAGLKRIKFFIFPLKIGKKRLIENKIKPILLPLQPSGNKYTNNIIKRASKICEHNFDLLGSGKTNLGPKINWHCDFKSGYCWNPKTFYLNIKFGHKGGVDIKVPWELSRFYHLITLGQAYRLTNDEKYSKEFVDEVEDWLQNNTPQQGVNWQCAMEVAIRACNWIYGFSFFKNSPLVTDKFLLKFKKSLFLHGEHIEKNLEKGLFRTTSNHYLANTVGLIYLGLFLKDQKWLNFGIKELRTQMEKQVYEDGCNFEASTCYHRLALELFFFTTLLMVINNKEFIENDYKKIAEKIFGKDYVQKLYRMFEVVLYLLKPNGSMPQIGDNDNGRLHVFKEREVLDMRYLLTLGAIFFKEPKFKIKEFGFSEEAIWLFGKSGYEVWQNLQENSLLNIKSKSFSNAGWHVMRNNKDYCLISCGPNGQNGKGGHCHNDKLSFELMIDKRDIIVDPGTYIYTPLPDWRNKFRSTGFHNTIVIKGIEQNRLKTIFSMEEDSRCDRLIFEEDENKIIFEGEYHGYEKIIHRRKIVFDKNKKELSVEDKLKGLKEEFHNNLVLSPKISPDDISINTNYEITDGFYSESYGKKENTKFLRIKGLSYKIKLK